MNPEEHGNSSREGNVGQGKITNQSPNEFEEDAVMVAVLAALISSLRPLVLGTTATKFHSTFGIPFPKVLHRVFDDEFVNQYEEVLVIGDVHGCHDELQKLINSVSQGEYVNSKILKIFVGDLVNKGPKNKDVIEYMMAHSGDCFSVRGNHDEVVIREYQKYKQNGECLEKNEWMKHLTDDEVTYLISLPYTISVPSLKAIIVHAGLLPNVKLEEINPSDLVSMRNMVCSEGNETYRGAPLKPTKDDTHGEPWSQLWPGPEHVYFGHDAKRMLQKQKFATGLDTGCVYGKMLTGVFIMGPRIGSFVHVNALKVYLKPGAKEV